MTKFFKLLVIAIGPNGTMPNPLTYTVLSLIASATGGGFAWINQKHPWLCLPGLHFTY